MPVTVGHFTRSTIALGWLLMGVAFDSLHADLLGSSKKISPAAENTRPWIAIEGKQIFTKAIEYYRDKEWDQCLSELRSLRSQDATLPHERLVLAWLHLSQKNIIESKRELEILAAISPHDPQLLLTFGQIAIAERRLADAAAQLEKGAMVRLPQSWSSAEQEVYAVDILESLSTVYSEQKRWQDALEVSSRWLVLRPKHPASKLRMARALFELGEKHKVQILLDEIERDTSLATPSPLLLAEIAFASGKLDEARDAIELAVNRFPNHLAVHLWHAEFSLDQNELVPAKVSLDRAAQLESDSIDLLRLRATYEFMSEHYALCIQLCRKALSMSAQTDTPRLAKAELESLISLALFLQSEPSIAEGKSLAQSLALEYSDHPVFVGRLGWIELLLGNREGALLLIDRAMILQAIQSSSEDVEILYYWLAAQSTLRTDSNENDEPSALLFRQALKRMRDYFANRNRLLIHANAASELVQNWENN